VDTIGNVQNLHHRDFGQVPATMLENVTINENLASCVEAPETVG
jgi:hypothetical protein